jgi:DNA repair photolyase
MFIGKPVKTILNKKKHRDSWFLDDYTLNLYKGCPFNCLFCYVKGSIYGEHNERVMEYKSNAIEILDKELAIRAAKNQYGFIVMSSSTEPWSQAEESLKLTQKALELILHYRFPLHVITRSDLILRDWDLLRKIEENAIVPDDLKSQLKGLIVTFSFNTLDDSTAKIFEPGATAPSKRLDIFQRFGYAGFNTGISLMPLLPFITDKGSDLENYFRIFKACGAKYLMPSTLTLFGKEKSDSKQQIFRAIEKHYPELMPKYKKFFDLSDYMPKYYNDAFAKKMKELSLKYSLPDRIFTVI